MFRKRFCIYRPLALAVGVLIFLAAPARGGHVSGGGWMASWDSSLDNMIGLTLLSTSNDSVSFAAHLQFEGSPNGSAMYEPMAFTFQQTSLNAKPTIMIEQEAVVNQTADAWSGYDFMLEPSAAGGVKFDEQRTFAPGQSFSIAPFTTRTIEEDGKELYLDGGEMPAAPAGENVFNPGELNGALYIDGAPLGGGTLRTFTLLQGPQGASAIPLPPASVAGLWSLGALGIGRLCQAWRRQRAT
jgi:hypothetical protein